MARRLNSIFLISFLLLSLHNFSYAQEDETLEEKNYSKDYKNREQFDKFTRRRHTVSIWQINQLKEGALVVRLRTNALLEQALIKQGNAKLANEKRLETLAANMNIMRAYLNFYTFSKVYFIYSNSSDSLLNGARSNIFLDTATMEVNPSIVMTEKFYLLAERDYVYNSSIGYVPEDSARKQVERGNPIKEMAIVVKNKYGHQLNKPFPYVISDIFNPRLRSAAVEYVNIRGEQIPFNVTTGKKSDGGHPDRGEVGYNYKGKLISLYIPKYFIYDRLSLIVSRLNDELYKFYNLSPQAEVKWIDPSIRPFLY